MDYDPGLPIKVTFDTSDELQALGWAASEMRRAFPEDPDIQSAYQTALHATGLRHSRSEEKDLTLEGDEADALLTTLQRWVQAGPPKVEGQITDAARAKSYKTACVIVAKIIELPIDSNSPASS